MLCEVNEVDQVLKQQYIGGLQSSQMIVCHSNCRATAVIASDCSLIMYNTAIY